jgi:hypothetical protein
MYEGRMIGRKSEPLDMRIAKVFLNVKQDGFGYKATESTIWFYEFTEVLKRLFILIMISLDTNMLCYQT